MGESGNPDESETNHYEMLGVRTNATPEQIRLAYRRAVRVCHPDHNGNNPAAAELFRQLTRSYKLLRDPQQRMAFDAGLGLGNRHQPWYGKSRNKVAETPEPGTLVHSAGPLDSAAATLELNGLSTAEVAASLIEAGNPYEQSWQAAWRAHHAHMAERMQLAAHTTTLPVSSLDPTGGEWEPHRDGLWTRLRHGMGRILN